MKLSSMVILVFATNGIIFGGAAMGIGTLHIAHTNGLVAGVVVGIASLIVFAMSFVALGWWIERKAS